MAEEQDAKEGPKASPRFAMAGQIFGRRRTVFAAVPITQIRPNPKQPRQHFDPEGLENLADSIRARGVLQPLIARLDGNDGFTLIAGERRLRASELAGVTQVPVILSNHDLREVALEENIQRQDLNALEEAEASNATLPADLGRLAGADVYLLFIESYGMALFRNPDTAGQFAAWASGWEERSLSPASGS